MAAYHIPSSYKIELQRYLALQPDGWWLASLDEQAAAVGGIINYGHFSYVGMVGVLPGLQRYGLGTLLMEALLVWAERRQCPTVLLDASTEGVNLYRKLGFVEDDKAILLSLVEEPTRRPEIVAGQVFRLREEDIPEIVAFDRPYFGAERERVFRRLLYEYPERAFVSRQASGEVSGYLFVQSRMLGPWVAQTSADAERLLVQGLAMPFGSDRPRVIISPKHREAVELLEGYGFRQMRTLSHMRLGPRPERQRERIYGQVSFAIG
jgi:N-acetylglutamate synthase-like GNAT family acetyltransferase